MTAQTAHNTMAGVSDESFGVGMGAVGVVLVGAETAGPGRSGGRVDVPTNADRIPAPHRVPNETSVDGAKARRE